jgi:hypothetical protein
MRWTVLALAFIAELGAWGAMGYAVHHLVGGGWRGLAMGGLAAAVAIVCWGLFASPHSNAPVAAALVTKILVFGGAVALLCAAGDWRWGLALALLIGVAHLGVHVTSPGAPN